MGGSASPTWRDFKAAFQAGIESGDIPTRYEGAGEFVGWYAHVAEQVVAAAAAESDRLREGVERLRDEWAAAAAEDEQWLNGPRVSVGEAQELPAVIAKTRDHVNDLRALLDGGAK